MTCEPVRRIDSFVGKTSLPTFAQLSFDKCQLQEKIQHSVVLGESIGLENSLGQRWKGHSNSDDGKNFVLNMFE